MTVSFRRLVGLMRETGALGNCTVISLDHVDLAHLLAEGGAGR